MDALGEAQNEVLPRNTYPDTIRNYAYDPDNVHSRLRLRNHRDIFPGYSIASSNACFTCVRDGS